MSERVTEADLHAYADNALEGRRLAEVEAYLAARPDKAEQVAFYRRQGEDLRNLFDPVLDEPVPHRMRWPRPTPLLRYAAVAAWVALGGMVGWALHGADRQGPAEMAFAQQAAVAHAVYAPEVRHPVEVGADQEAHLVAWLSRRLGENVRAPRLTEAGYDLVGGRLLPGGDGPAAQFMYQDGRGNRLTLYVRTAAGGNRKTAFRYAQEGKLGVFYWVDGPLGYALSGEADKAQLMRVADTVYRQLNP